MSENIIEDLISNLTKLPGIGRKTAQRLAFFILSMPKDDALAISDSIKAVKEKAKFCSQCFNISNTDPCSICSDNSRERNKICVVEETSNIVMIEKTGVFKGLYHVLMGALSPVDDIGPEKLKIKELAERVARDNIQEVVIATNPNTKGELTAKYIGDMLRPFNIKITRIAYGLPIGSDIEFADEVTLAKSLEGRREI
ncbi:MAG: recombination mediator RecR [Thermodesulfovibrionales bacterium]